MILKLDDINYIKDAIFLVNSNTNTEKSNSQETRLDKSEIVKKKGMISPTLKKKYN